MWFIRSAMAKGSFTTSCASVKTIATMATTIFISTASTAIVHTASKKFTFLPYNCLRGM